MCTSFRVLYTFKCQFLDIFICYVKAKGPTLTCPAAQSTVLHQDTLPAACRQIYHPEMFWITWKTYTDVCVVIIIIKIIIDFSHNHQTDVEEWCYKWVHKDSRYPIFIFLTICFRMFLFYSS